LSPDALTMAHGAARWQRMSIAKGRMPMNAFLDARSNLCYTQINVEQDHNFDRNSGRALHGSGSSQRAIVHPLQRAGAKSL
jgi:hypothetical protein